MLARGKANGSEYVRVPSLFETWGIEKFLDIRPGHDKPKLVYRIPPIEHYAKHYFAMLLAVGAQSPKVLINDTDRLVYRREIHMGVDEIWTKMKPDYTALGYSSTWEKALKQPGAPWELDGEPQTHSTREGLT